MSHFQENERSRRGRSRYFLLGLLLLFLTAGVFAGPMVKEVSAATNGFKIVKEGGKKVCYYYKNGKKLKSSFLNIKGKKYLFDEKGHQVIGFQKGKTGGYIRYFFGYLGAKGHMAVGFMKDSQGNVRYFNPKNGLMARGFYQIDGKYRYFHSQTGILYTGIRKVGKYYYYFQGNSNIKKRGIRYQGGWRSFGNNKYYFNTKDGHAHIGWMTLNGKRYRLNGKGVLLTNTTFTVGGKKYKSDKNGVVTEVKDPAAALASVYTQKKTFSYTRSGSGLRVYDSTNGRYYNMVNEFATDYGVANGALTDRDILAALCEAEAGDQGVIGMEAVAMCILNRTIKSDKEFPSEVRLVIYQSGPRQYSTTMGAVNQRLRGGWFNKTAAYQAADAAIKIFTNYRATGAKRVIPGFYNNQDMNFMYFMMTYAYSSAVSSYGLRAPAYVYKDHSFFVDWY